MAFHRPSPKDQGPGARTVGFYLGAGEDALFECIKCALLDEEDTQPWKPLKGSDIHGYSLWYGSRFVCCLCGKPMEKED